MNYHDITLFPNLLEESRRELDRELERKRQIREARAARLDDQPSRSARLGALLHLSQRRNARRRLAEGC